MKDSTGAAGLDRWLSALLQNGTRLASAVIAVGLITGNMRVVAAGVLLFILLPTLRVVVMLVAFLRARQYGFAGAAALVLTIILLGVAAGTRTPGNG